MTLTTRGETKTMKPSKFVEEEDVERRWWRRVTSFVFVKREVEWRRVAYSAKVALALSLVSLSVLLQEVFKEIGNNALWAILTVIVVFEFTVGTTCNTF